MEKKERIRQIRKVLDKHHRVTFNKLKEIVVEKKGLMATQTFSDALKEGVESRIIIREEGLDGKRRVVRYYNPENAKEENDYYQELISDLDSFSHKVEILKEEFPKLNNIEKGRILFSFSDWLQVIGSKIGMGAGYFVGSSKFTELYQKSIFSSLQDIIILSISGDLKLQSTIMNEYFLGWNDIEQDNIEEIDKFLKIPIVNETR